MTRPDPTILSQVLASTSARRLSIIIWLSSLTADVPNIGVKK
jgi:hypothetical protein